MKTTRRSFLKQLSVSAGASAGMLIAGMEVVQAQAFPKPPRQENFDIVIVGTGFAALSMALTCLDEGKTVALLEKRDDAGGSSYLSGGQMCMPITDDEDGYERYINAFIEKSPRGRADLAEVMAKNAYATHAWMATHGFKQTPVTPEADKKTAASIFSPSLFEGSGAAIDSGIQEILRLGGKIFYQTKALQLIVDENGKIAGIRAKDEGGLVDYNAKDAVLLAMGGFAANKEVLADYVDPLAEFMTVRGRKTATGDSISLVKQVGGGIIGMGGMDAVHVAATHKDNPTKGQPSSSIPFVIAVNKDGKRYVDESKGYVSNGKAAMRQPDQTVALVFDANARRVPGVLIAMNVFKNNGLEIVQADTLEELGQIICDDPQQFVKTIEEFNAAIQPDGSANVTPPRTAFAPTTEKAPFFAFYPLKPAIGFTFGGIKINTQGQVVAQDDSVIDGLYAAGECASVHSDDYLSGSMVDNCFILGRIAALTACGKTS